MMCYGVVLMTPASCCTASSGQWYRSFWARSLCSWRCVLVPLPFEPRPFRRENVLMKFAKTCPPYLQIAAGTRPETPSHRTLTLNCRHRQGPCRCLQYQCDGVIENIKLEQKVVSVLWNQISLDADELVAEDAANNPLLYVVCSVWSEMLKQEDEGKSSLLPLDSTVVRHQHLSSDFNWTSWSRWTTLRRNLTSIWFSFVMCSSHQEWWI